MRIVHWTIPPFPKQHYTVFLFHKRCHSVKMLCSCRNLWVWFQKIFDLFFWYIFYIHFWVVTLWPKCTAKVGMPPVMFPSSSDVIIFLFCLGQKEFENFFLTHSDLGLDACRIWKNIWGPCHKTTEIQFSVCSFSSCLYHPLILNLYKKKQARDSSEAGY